MNRQIFNQLGGFPLETDNFDWIQNAYDIFNALGYIAGDKTIISGCVVAGGNTGNGFVFVGGELFQFVGGPTQAKVRILETSSTKEFENGDVNPVHNQRYITFASGVGEMDWADFTRTESIKNLQSRILPPLTNPQLFSGAIGSIPSGWQLCDGTNGTPNLKSRFIVGYDPAVTDYNAIGKIGGLKEVTLLESQMPAHNHSGNTNSAGDHTHTVATSQAHDGFGKFTGGGTANEPASMSTNSSGNHSHAFTTNNKGGGLAHENRPPYYVLAYIIYIG